VENFLSGYAFIIALWRAVQKLRVEKKRIPPGLSIEFLPVKYIISERTFNPLSSDMKLDA